jgi:hypothetical protein
MTNTKFHKILFWGLVGSLYADRQGKAMDVFCTASDSERA